MTEPVLGRSATPTGVLLYGPPAAGKDTINAELTARDQRFQRYRRPKHGGRLGPGYRPITGVQLEQLRAGGTILWENSGYGATYLVEQTGLIDLADSGAVPVVHLGQPAAIGALTTGVLWVRWHVIELTCSRAIAVDRLSQRDPADVHERLAVYDATPRLADAELCVDTGRTSPADAAQLVAECVGLTGIPTALAHGDSHPVVVAVVTSELGVLIGRRADHRPEWVFLGGKIEAGESAEAAAVREVAEESGLPVTAVRWIGERRHPDTDAHVTYIACLALVAAVNARVTAPTEITEVRWVRIPELERLLPTIYHPVRDYLETVPHLNVY
jgi:guanylate kinase